MQSMRATHQRVFVEQDGRPHYLDRVVLEELGQKGNLVLTGHPPEGVDLTSPQTLCLVFQKIADPRTFFDMQYPGMIMVLEGFRAIKDDARPVMLMKNLTTGEVTIPVPGVECTCEKIQQWVMTGKDISISTLRR